VDSLKQQQQGSFISIVKALVEALATFVFQQDQQHDCGTGTTS
jgi:hypothetical protein